ncbi:SICA-like antigen [Plasmodium coatneyi]|uniref:SICA-like antigen n=1 Tax=Plasmodium coatneyi TaxID=208452 RepID=A0A1B1E5E9_9APIC|nr:SICA-like antigen [Plasmodium coatneyi]ANQ10197.1 SICA-like antigen [Plasmodium coatneyi]
MGEFQYFAEFMEEWLTRKGASKTNADVLLERIEESMDHMLQNIYQDADLEEKVYCNELDNNNEPKLKDEASIELCKILIRIFYWIGGLRQRGDKEKRIWEWIKEVLTAPDEKKLQDYLRCIMGKIVIVRIFGKHCRLNEVTPIVKKAIDETKGEKGFQKEHEKCEKIDFQSLSIGGKFFSEEIEKSIMQDKLRRGETIKRIKEQGKCGGKNFYNETENNKIKGKWKSTAELLGLKDEDHLQELIADSNTWSRGGLDKILCYVRDKGGIEKVKGILVQGYNSVDGEYRKSTEKAQRSGEDRCASYHTGRGTNEEDSPLPSVIQRFSSGQSNKSPATDASPATSNAENESSVQTKPTEGDPVVEKAKDDVVSDDKKDGDVIAGVGGSTLTQLTGQKDASLPPNPNTAPISSGNSAGSTFSTPEGTGSDPKTEITAVLAATPIDTSASSQAPIRTPVQTPQYFGLFGPQKKRYKRMTQIPRPPLEEHNDGTDLTISYAPHGYRMIKTRHPTHKVEMLSAEPIHRKLNKTTIIDIHLESLNECPNQNHESELMSKGDFLQIIVEEFMKFGFMNKGNIKGGTKEHNVSFSENGHPSLTCNVPYWIAWIEKNKIMLEEIKTQPWFYDLKVSWNEYQSDSEQSLLNDDVPSMESHKKELWRIWVRKQHSLMEANGQTDWFKHLLDNIEEVNGAEKLEQQQLCQVSYKPNNRLTVKLWMLILALVFEECEMEENVCNKDLYLDHLLQSI